jgi:hypothetical protein
VIRTARSLAAAVALAAPLAIALAGPVGAGPLTAAAAHSPVHAESTVCTVFAGTLTIRQSPGGATLATAVFGGRFRVDDFRDNVWVFGADYRGGNLIAYGYVLRQYITC